MEVTLEDTLRNLSEADRNMVQKNFVNEEERQRIEACPVLKLARDLYLQDKGQEA